MFAKHILYTITFLTSCLLASCGSALVDSLKSTPTAIGSTNQIVVLCDQAIWESPIGDTFRYRFESAYPLLPAPEPLFDVKYYDPIQLVAHPLRRELRTYVYLADLSDENSLTTKQVIEDLGSEIVYKVKEDPSISNMIGRDKWAKGQLIIYLFAPTKDQMTSVINKNFYSVARRINQFDNSMIDAQVYLHGEHIPTAQLLKNKFGAAFKVPGDYVVAKEDTASIWLRRDDGVLISNIILHKVPYRNQKQISKEGIKKLINKVGKDYVTSNTPGSYLRVNDEDLPIYTYAKTLDNAYALEARGIWELTYDYMGGPFLSYLIKYPEKDSLLLIDTFLYAPGKKKRNSMQQLEHIVSSLSFDTSSD